MTVGGRPVGIFGRRWKDNITINLKHNRIRLAQDRAQRQIYNNIIIFINIAIGWLPGGSAVYH